MTKGVSKLGSAPEIVGGWTVGASLGRGGNGEVHRVRRGDQVGAMKRLAARAANSPARVARFRDEVEALRRCQDIDGVLPLLDHDLAPAAGARPWFVMGAARPILEELGDRPSLRRVIEAAHSIAGTLRAMHARGFSHRDIKPENLFWFDGRWAVGDFGLVSFEGKTAKTTHGERIGPMHYIAPEMLNTAIDADGRAADVYSLAKTLWVLATGQRFPLPGVYDPTHEAFRLLAYLSAERTGPLDKLLAAATAFDPASRLSMQAFVSELGAWLSPPPPRQAGRIKLDTSAFAIDMDRGRQAMEVEAARNQRNTESAATIGLHLREALRPLAKEIEQAFVDQEFVSVALSIDNHRYGFEVGASIPTGIGQVPRINLFVGIDPNNAASVHVRCSITLTGNLPSAGGAMLWEKQVTFVEGGSEEELLMSRLQADLLDELPRATSRALKIAYAGDEWLVEGQMFRIDVRSEGGEPIVNADIALIGNDGVFVRASTLADGSATLGPVLMAGVVVYVAHAKYLGAMEVGAASIVVTLRERLMSGSMIATNGWTAVAGLAGQVSLVHDAQARTYLYADNVAVEGGAAQPVPVALGSPLQLRGRDGRTVTLLPKAVRGPCFLLDVIEGGERTF